MSNYFKLENVYNDFIENYINSYFSKYVDNLNLTMNSQGAKGSYQTYGLINNKFQFNFNGLNKSTQIQRPNNWSGHLYQSPKYERYQTVFLRVFSEYYDGNYGTFGNKLAEYFKGTTTEYNTFYMASIYRTCPIHIYGRCLVYGLEPKDILYPAYNPDQLDVYYDTIYTLNDYQYYSTTNMNDPIFYNKFGNDIMPLLTLPMAVPFDTIKQVQTSTSTSNTLYNKDTYNLQSEKFSVDKPSEYPNEDHITEHDNSINYKFNNYFKNSTGYVYSLSTFDLYESLKYIYNYFTNETINNIKNYNIFTINNEYSIISGKYILKDSYYTVYTTDFGYSISFETINTTPLYKITSIINNKSIIFEPGTYVDYTTAIGTEITEQLYDLFLINGGGLAANKCNFDVGTTDVNISKYNYINKCLKEIDANSLSSIIKTYTDKTLNFTLTYNDNNKNKLNAACFQIGSTNIFTRNTNTLFNIPSSIVTPLLEGNVGKVSTPFGTNRIYTYNVPLYTEMQYFHKGDVISKKLVDSTSPETPFGDMISNSDISTLSNYTRLSDFEYDVKTTSSLNDILINNEFVDLNRYKIYGVAVNLNSSKTLFIRDTTFEQFKEWVRLGNIKVMPFPVPMLTNVNNQNICTESTISHVNEHFNLNNTHNLVTDQTTPFSPSDYKIQITDYVNNSTNLSTYDKNSYNVYNMNSFKYDFYQLQKISSSSYNYIYMIYDTVYNSFELIKLQDLINFNSHFGKLSINTNYNNTNNKVSIYQDTSSNATSRIYNGVNITDSYPITSSKVQYDNLRLVNYQKTIGKMSSISLVYNVYNKVSQIYTNKNATLHESDFTISGNDVVFDLKQLADANEVLVGFLSYDIYMTMFYRAFSYTDNFIVKVSTNFTDLIVSNSVIISTLQYSSNVIAEKPISEDFINIATTKYDNILPQILYNKNISLSLFDISDDVQSFVPDNKLCVIFNHYLDNSITVETLTDVTSYDTTDVAIFDKWYMSYKSYKDQLKILPALIKPNINKYIKVWMKLEINELSTDLIETFEYDNLYDISMKDINKGVLVVDGQITDATNINSFDDLLKEYKINLTFTASHNVNTTITIPISATIQYEIFNNYSDYTNNTPTTSYDIREETILMEVKNRGEYITSSTDYTPKLLDYIEYYDIYPEYSQQTESLHKKVFEFKLTSSDSSVVKVSELYFDIFLATDDTFVAIPNDYESHIDPENEISNVTYSNNKKIILDYINQLIRFKCPNCADTHLKLNVVTKPKYFGFNIQSMNIGCYSHNIKLEYFIPYIFYKESANTVMMIDKKSSIEKVKIPAEPEVMSSFQGSQSNFTNDYFDQYIGDGVTKDDLIKFIDKPIKSKVTCVVFNSSYNNKKVIFDLESNPTPKTIHNTRQEFSLAPLEFRIISLVEDIDTTDYSDSFDSGLAIYNLSEHDIITDTTTFIETIHLSIPSMDDYLRAVMNFFDKSAKLVQVDYTQNLMVINSSNDTAAYRSKDSLSTTKIIKTISSNLIVENEQNLMDIDYKFYINEVYDAIIDRSILTDILDQLAPLGDTIYIKIPILLTNSSYTPNIMVDYIDKFKLPEDTTTTIEINNLFDSNINYLQLVGKRTNVDHFTFVLNGVITITNMDLLNRILTNSTLDLSTFFKYGVTMNIPIVDPAALLGILFQDFGKENAFDIVNYFVGKGAIIPTNPTTTLNTILSCVPYGSKMFKASSTKQISLIGSSTRKELPSIEMEEVGSIVDTGSITIYNTDLSGKYEGYICSGFMPDEVINPFTNALSYFVKLYDSYENTPLEESPNQDQQTFDDVHNVITSNNILTDSLNSSGIFTSNLRLLINNGIKKRHYMSVKCDNNYDSIIAARICSDYTTQDGYEFYYTGDNKISFSDTDNYLSIDFSTLRWSTLQIVVDGKEFSSSNAPYTLFSTLQKKLLEKPLLVKTMDYSKHPITIVADTNYKMIFEMPIQIFKATQSYLTIDKIRIVDSFINPTDYCIIFGDNNERYNIKTDEYKLLGKTYDKYNTENINILIRGFNIANQTGEFYTIALIYYTFNGEQFVVSRDIKYRVELPSVLDNEYLIAEVTRLDNVKQPTELITVGDNTIIADIGTHVNDSSLAVLTNYDLGTAGCDPSFPDLNWFKI